MDDYTKELETIQTWIKATAGINSYRLAEAKPKVPRPVILFETPARGASKPVATYTYVVPVKQYGKLFISNLEEANRIQSALIKDLHEKRGVLPIMDGTTKIGYLKAIVFDFREGQGLDIPFTLQYEVAYGITRPVMPPPATTVNTKVVTK